MSVQKFVAMTLLTCFAASGVAVESVFIGALREGYAQMPLESSPSTATMIEAAHKQSGSTAPLFIKAYRIEKFINQPTCGRVGFVLTQPATGKIWPKVGGEFNICEDGTAPLRMCAGEHGQLKPPDAVCANGQPPVDTAEVSAAIRRSIARGGLSGAQAVEETRQRGNRQ